MDRPCPFAALTPVLGTLAAYFGLMAVAFA